jgi:hypothetical protein
MIFQGNQFWVQRSAQAESLVYHNSEYGDQAGYAPNNHSQVLYSSMTRERVSRYIEGSTNNRVAIAPLPL